MKLLMLSLIIVGVTVAGFIITYNLHPANLECVVVAVNEPDNLPASCGEREKVLAELGANIVVSFFAACLGALLILGPRFFLEALRPSPGFVIIALVILALLAYLYTNPEVIPEALVRALFPAYQ